MSYRITVVFDEKNTKRLRDHQVAKIKKTNSSCSFSKVVNLVLEEGLKTFKP